MAISLQRLTIYIYSAHRAVIFTIAQLSCLHLPTKTYCREELHPRTRDLFAIALIPVYRTVVRLTLTVSVTSKPWHNSA